MSNQEEARPDLLEEEFTDKSHRACDYDDQLHTVFYHYWSQ